MSNTKNVRWRLSWTKRIDAVQDPDPSPALPKEGDHAGDQAYNAWWSRRWGKDRLLGNRYDWAQCPVDDIVTGLVRRIDSTGYDGDAVTIGYTDGFDEGCVLDLLREREGQCAYDRATALRRALWGDWELADVDRRREAHHHARRVRRAWEIIIRDAARRHEREARRLRRILRGDLS